jgi:hypothetical protein
MWHLSGSTKVLVLNRKKFRGDRDFRLPWLMENSDGLPKKSGKSKFQLKFLDMTIYQGFWLKYKKKFEFWIFLLGMTVYQVLGKPGNQNPKAPC